MKTYATKPSHVRPRWHVIDAKNQVLGRLATEVSVLLQGKHKPIYAKHILTGDFVVIINAEKVKVTGAKLQQKMYRRHSGYPGALRETTMARLQEKHPDRIIRSAVKGMLPSTTSGHHMLRRLKVYAGDEHPHMAQVRYSETMEPITSYQDLNAAAAPPAAAAPVAVADETPSPVEAEVAAAAVTDAPASAEETPSDSPEAQAAEQPVADSPNTPPVSEVETEGAETPETTDQESDESQTDVEPDAETPEEKVEG